jgi:RNA polymerase sigma factor (sigma-70 family)
MEDNRMDETLVTDSQHGDGNALDILFKRYWMQILAFLFKNSFFKDESYLDDVRQEIFLTAFKEIKSNKFNPRGPGTFKRWLFEIARHQCQKSGTEQQHHPKTISQLYPDETTGIADDTLMVVSPEPTDYELIDKRLESALSRISPEEQNLMKLVSAGMSYQEIHEKEEFEKHSIDYLMLKVYNIRKKILGGE